MEPIHSLFYALGEFAYAIALADGKIQAEEKEKLHTILKQEFENEQEYDLSEIIFDILKKDVMGNVETVYSWALKEMKLNSHYLSPEMKEKFIRTLKRVAEAFPPQTMEETTIIEKFKQDIGALKGDPVFYSQKKITPEK